MIFCLSICLHLNGTEKEYTDYCLFHRAAVACVGAFYEKMGRMLGSSFPETVNNLLKSLKSAEVSFRLFYRSGLDSI